MLHPFHLWQILLQFVMLCGCFHPNLQIFPSTAQYGRVFWATFWSLIVLFFLLLFAGAGIKHKAQTIVLVLAFVELYVFLWVALWALAYFPLEFPHVRGRFEMHDCGGLVRERSAYRHIMINHVVTMRCILYFWVVTWMHAA